MNQTAWMLRRIREAVERGDDLSQWPMLKRDSTVRRLKNLERCFAGELAMFRDPNDEGMDDDRDCLGEEDNDPAASPSTAQEQEPS